MKTKNIFYSILVMAFSFYACEKEDLIIPEAPITPAVVNDTVRVDSIAVAYDVTQNPSYLYSNFSQYSVEVTPENLESLLPQSPRFMSPFYDLENETAYSFGFHIVPNPQYDGAGNLTSDGFLKLFLEKIDLDLDTIKIRWTEIVNKSNITYRVSWVKDSIFIKNASLNYKYKVASALYYKKNGKSLDIHSTSILDSNGMNPDIIKMSFSNIQKDSYLECSMKFENNLPQELQALSGMEISAKFFNSTYLLSLFGNESVNDDEFRSKRGIMALSNKKYIQQIF